MARRPAPATVLLCLAAVLAGCGNDASSPDPAEREPELVTNIVVSVGELRGSGYPVDRVVIDVAGAEHAFDVADDPGGVCELTVSGEAGAPRAVVVECFDDDRLNARAAFELDRWGTSERPYVHHVQPDVVTDVPTDDLALWIPLTGDAADRIAEGREAQVLGAAAFVEDRFGVPGCALRWAEQVQDAGLLIGDITPVAFNRPFTASFWYRHEVVNEYPKRLFDYMPDQDTGWYSDLGLWIESRQSLFRVRTHDHSSEVVAFDPLRTTSWHHVVITSPTPYVDRGERSYAVWVDGRPVCGRRFYFQAPSHLDGSGDLWLGRLFAGTIDDVRLYDRALTTSEIQNLFHEGGWLRD